MASSSASASAVSSSTPSQSSIAATTTPTTATTAATPASTASTTVKRACDACHRRKVKCDGLQPCRNCGAAQLSCTYNAIPQKKGPKGSRAKVISELRETQRQTSLTTKVANRLNGVQSPPCSPTLSPTPGLLTAHIIKEGVDFYFAHMYPTLPILHRGRLEQQMMFADQNRDTYCLVSALCAFMMIQPGMTVPGGEQTGLDAMPAASLVSGQLLMEEAIRVRKGYDYLEAPTLNSLATSFFLFGCYVGLDQHNKAWFHLREATTLALILGLHKEDSYHQCDAIEASRRRRLYWLLFVTERSYALQRHRPLSLHSTISLPSPHDDPTEPAAPLTGFVHLVNLYRPFDDVFMSLWNKTRSDCTPVYLAALQKRLSELVPPYLNCPDTQTVEIRVTQQWLRTMVWQLSIQSGCLRSGHTDPSLTFQYPLEIARELVSLTSHFSHHSMEVHGVALVEKLFDIACSLTDVLALLSSPSDPFVMGPREYLNQIIQLISTLRHGDSRFLPVLLNKVHEVMPRLANPILQSLPDSAAAGGGIDIFDGFGNAGMGAPAVPDFKQEFKSFHLEDLSSPSANESVSSSESPFSQAQMMGSGSMDLEFSSLAPGADFNTFPSRSRSHSNYGLLSTPMQEYQGMNLDMEIGGMDGSLPFR